jgi:GAF domain-containing protein
VLDIQTTLASAFDQQDIETLQLLADQLVVAIENAQLAERVEVTLAELNSANQFQAGRAWQTTLQERTGTALEFDGLQVRKLSEPLPAAVLQQLGAGKAVVLGEDSAQGNHLDATPGTLVVPLTLLNQLIGVIGLQPENPNHHWTAEEIAVAEAAASRAALTLENARLLEESQRRAMKERTISEATARIGSALDLENILHATAEELGRVLQSSEVILQFRADAPEQGN